MKNIYFLAGLPGSGTNVLSGILNQRQDIYASRESELADILMASVRAWSSAQGKNVNNVIAQQEISKVLKSICEAKYSAVQKPIILDCSNKWVDSHGLQIMGSVFNYTPKIIVTVRSIEDCVAYFVEQIKPANLEYFLREDQLISSLKECYQAIHKVSIKFPEQILFVDYDDLVSNPIQQLNKIHKFLGLEDFEYDLSRINQYALNRPSYEILDVWHTQFLQPRFWRGETVSRAGVQMLDRQLAFGLMGNLDEGWKIAQELALKEPWNHRAAFNRGWYMMWKGHLLEGQKLLDRGRIEKVYGNGVPQTSAPIWDGVSKGTVLLNLEGGLGDQIHGVRFARDIADRGCDVIVACSKPLACLFRDVPGIKAVVQHEAVFGVVHDFWVPSMSGIIPLGYEYKDIIGTPYITKPKVKPHYGMRIGLRWQGNPQFEHEQHRLFPAHLMFDALKDVQADFISLQRDEGSEHRPPWIREVPLNHWEDTRQAIASCDLVISSCTSVAHLSAAMGVPTWIIVPILPYYLWAKPGKTSPWYDSVTLFRQEVFGDWTDPFKKISSELSNLQKKQA